MTLKSHVFLHTFRTPLSQHILLAFHFMSLCFFIDFVLVADLARWPTFHFFPFIFHFMSPCFCIVLFTDLARWLTYTFSYFISCHLAFVSTWYWSLTSPGLLAFHFMSLYFYVNFSVHGSTNNISVYQYHSVQST